MNFVADMGSGKAVLFLHGIPSRAAGLEPLWRPMLGRHRVLAPELPGYGGSARLDGRYDFGRVNGALEAELGARGVRELWGVVGFSGGAYRALLLALDGRVPVARIALLGGAAGPEEEERPLYRQFAAMVRAEPLGPALLGTCRERMLSAPFRERSPGRSAEIDAWVLEPAREVLADELDAFAAAPSLLARLGGLRQPVLARVGALDAACPPAKSAAIAAAAKHAEVQVVPGVGHALEIEDPEGTARALEAFFG